eukprot:s1102_g19.t1
MHFVEVPARVEGFDERGMGRYHLAQHGTALHISLVTGGIITQSLRRSWLDLRCTMDGFVSSLSSCPQPQDSFVLGPFMMQLYPSASASVLALVPAGLSCVFHLNPSEAFVKRT